MRWSFFQRNAQRNPFYTWNHHDAFQLLMFPSFLSSHKIQIRIIFRRYGFWCQFRKSHQKLAKSLIISVINLMICCHCYVYSKQRKNCNCFIFGRKLCFYSCCCSIWLESKIVNIININIVFDLILSSSFLFFLSSLKLLYLHPTNLVRKKHIESKEKNQFDCF